MIAAGLLARLVGHRGFVGLNGASGQLLHTLRPGHSAQQPAGSQK